MLLRLVAVGLIEENSMPDADRGSKFSVAEMLDLSVSVGIVSGARALSYEASIKLLIAPEVRVSNSPAIHIYIIFLRTLEILIKEIEISTQPAACIKVKLSPNMIMAKMTASTGSRKSSVPEATAPIFFMLLSRKR
ncbi:hypothetical protein ES703_84567 [subsurface metagenome]